MRLMAVQNNSNQSNTVTFGTGYQGISCQGGVSCFSGKGSRIGNRCILFYHVMVVGNIAALSIFFGRRHLVAACATDFHKIRIFDGFLCDQRHVVSCGVVIFVI